MNTWLAIVTLLSLILLPAGLFALFWFYAIKRGWASRELLAASITVFLSLVIIVIWLGVQDYILLFIGLSIAVLSGISFFVFLKTSPIANSLLRQNQQDPTNWLSLSEEERDSRKESARLVIRDIFVIGFIQNLPIVVGVVIILLSKGAQSNMTISLALFVMGFTGILRIILRPKQTFPQPYVYKRKVASNIFITLCAWGLALYGLFNR